MPTNRRLLRRSHRTTMTLTQEMELWLGPGDNGSSFESDAHRRETWFRYRDRLVRQWGKSGRRPMGWWLYESPFRNPRHPGVAHERSSLYEFSDILSADERTELEAWWRKEFELSWRPNFFFFRRRKNLQQRHCSRTSLAVGGSAAPATGQIDGRTPAAWPGCPRSGGSHGQG